MNELTNIEISPIDKNSIWSPANSEIYNAVILFRDIFIDQRIQDLSFLFVSDFGFHNGYNFNDYINHEMEEFLLKTQKFGLTKNAHVQCYEIGHDLIYFSLGKKEDLALFEAIFGWNKDQKKFKGNGYQFKIEPKLQFIKTINNNQSVLSYKRRINLTPPSINPSNINSPSINLNNHNLNNDNTEINKINTIFTKKEFSEFSLMKSELEAHLGGNYYNFEYKAIDENLMTFWDKIKIFTDQGVFNYYVLMRGVDHPIFINNMFPKVEKRNIILQNDIFPVILYVLLNNGEELYYKYPTEKFWSFEHDIELVCLTDSLSFDWIISFK